MKCKVNLLRQKAAMENFNSYVQGAALFPRHHLRAQRFCKKCLSSHTLKDSQHTVNRIGRSSFDTHL
jgi:hypothetical protein